MRITVLLCTLFFSTLSLADGDAAAGEAKSGTCAACHGANGVSSVPGYPHLAGQNYEYLLAQLKAFKSGKRRGASSAIMAPMTNGLSKEDMQDLAAFYSSMKK